MRQLEYLLYYKLSLICLNLLNPKIQNSQNPSVLIVKSCQLDSALLYCYNFFLFHFIWPLKIEQEVTILREKLMPEQTERNRIPLLNFKTMGNPKNFAICCLLGGKNHLTEIFFRENSYLYVHLMVEIKEWHFYSKFDFCILKLNDDCKKLLWIS